MSTMSWATGDSITASRLQDMVPIMAVKTSGTSRTSTTTVTADPDLVLTLRPNVTYLCRLNMAAIGDAAGDIKVAYSTTGTITEVLARRKTGGMATGGGAPSDNANMNAAHSGGTLSTQQPYGCHASVRNSIEEWFVVAAGASGGTISMTWAQNTSSATATQVTTGTFLAIPVNQV